MALWEIDPWGPGRDDKRSAVQSLHIQGVKFDAIGFEYPYIGDGDEDDEELIAMLDADHEDKTNGCENSTA